MDEQGVVGFEVSGNGSTGGLLRLILDSRALQFPSLQLAVKINGEQVFIAAVVPDGGGALHVNFHTHLFDAGENRIDVVVSAQGVSRSASYTLHVQDDSRLAQEVRAALLKHDVPVVFVGDCDQGIYAQAQESIRSWIDQEDAIEEVDRKLMAGDITKVEADALCNFISSGFVVLREKLPEHMVDAANDAIDDALAKGYQGYELGSSQRLEQMHVNFPAIRDIWLHPPIHRFLSLVFNAASQPCQSLVYVYGSQQDAHQDTIHLTPFPAGMMCGVWIALEDVRAGAGELAVYPGSHRLPRVYMRDAGAAKVRGDWSEFGDKVVSKWRAMIDEARIEPMPYLAKRGDILVWHENLMHAGRPRIDVGLSRRSVVTHNFAKGAIVYYDSSGCVGYVEESHQMAE